MDIHEKKKILQESLRLSGLSETQIAFLTQEKYLLASIARTDLEQTGETNVLCPKCKTHPKTNMPHEGCNRYSLRCECGYLSDGEVE